MQSQENLYEKYPVMRYGNGIHIGMGIKFPINFSCKKITRKFPVIFVGTGIGMHIYSGNKIFKISGCLKFSHTENSQENAGSILLK